MKKRLVAAIAIGCASIGVGLAAANLFPEEALNEFRREPPGYGGTPVQRPTPAPSAASTALAYTDEDGYSVLSAWKHYWAQTHVILVRREIRADRSLDVSCLDPEFRTLYADAMKDFTSKASQNWVLEERLRPAQEFHIVAESELPQYDTRGRKPANAAGYFAFSAVGFSRDRRRAVVYVLHRDGHFGTGHLFLIRKDDKDAWVVVLGGSRCGWIT